MEKQIAITIDAQTASELIEAIREYYFLNEYASSGLEALYEQLEKEIEHG